MAREETTVESLIKELQQLRKHVDGCPDVPAPGETADSDDWIVDCDAQRSVRGRIDALITNLSSP